MSPIDLASVLKDYEGRWVALSDDYATVLGAGVTAPSAAKDAEAKGHADYTLMYVQPSNLLYSGGVISDRG